MPYDRMVMKDVSKQGRALAHLATEIERLDKSMKTYADAILADMQKRDGLMVCLKRLAKEMK
jgi:hypothetical protein